MSRIDKSVEEESRLVVARSWGMGGGEEWGWLLMDTGFILGVMKMFLSWIAVMVLQLCEYTEAIELHTWKGGILWYANYISMKQLFKKEREKKKKKGLDFYYSSQEI